MRSWFAIIPAAVSALLFAAASLAATQQRVALVIGNATYQELPLKNPVNDARAVAKRLSGLGFEVIKLENANRGEMEDAIADFEERLGPGNAGLFYYAGHGLQVRGQNYLVPVDAVIESESRVRTQAVPLSHVTSAMNYAESRINFILLDACRNNPFERSMRGGSRGLAAVDAAAGTLVSYATAPGSVAADGDGENGVYTGALLKALDRPGLTAEQVFKEVRKEVSRVTRRKQTPWESSSLTGDFYFNKRAAGSAANTPLAPAAGSGASRGLSEETAIELMFWETVVDSKNPAMFKEYLEQYPQGRFARLAELKLSSARKQPASTVQSKPRAAKVSNDVADITKLVQRWARAWEDNTRSTNAYAGFYDSQFQSRSMNRNAWVADKRKKAKKTQCIKVDLKNLDVEVASQGAVARFDQRYMSKTYCDVGPKTLLFARTPEGWRIRSEEQREFKRCPERC